MEGLYPWLQILWSRLSVKKDHFPSALLIVGKKGIGKSFLLKRLAQLILCSCSVKEEACNLCEDCRWFLTNHHPDFFELDAQEEVIKIDQIRSLQNWLILTPHHQQRVIIVNDVSRFNLFAQNAFLKILEEPPQSTYFMMAASNPSVILPTIYSRCQRFNLYVDHLSAQNWFKAQKIPALFYWLRETPLTAKYFCEQYLDLMPEFLTTLKLFLNKDTYFTDLQKIQRQFKLNDLVKLYYVLAYQLAFPSVDNLISWNKEDVINLQNLLDFEKWLINLNRDLQQVSLNENLIQENLALRFIGLFSAGKD